MNSRVKVQSVLDTISQRSWLTVATKRGVDIIGALIVLFMFSPFFLLISLVIKLGTPGPIFYMPQVVGYRGRRFTLFKFRTMVNNASYILQNDPKLLEEYRTKLKIENDPRVTSLGKFLRKYSLDEIPQLLNILRGEMSLVGPRVLSETELASYGDVQDKVLSVMPGLTGLWQASGRHTVSFERRVELDMYYVDHWNLWMDFVILLKTVPAVITGKGAE